MTYATIEETYVFKRVTFYSLRMEIFENAINNVSPETEARIRLSMEIVERISQLMQQKNMNQNDLARALGKTPSEISKWLSGTHNFTLKSIQKLEAFLGKPILKVVLEPIAA